MTYHIKDINADIAVSKDEALWQKVKKEAEGLIEQSKESLIIQEAMLKLSNAKIKEEMDKVLKDKR